MTILSDKPTGVLTLPATHEELAEEADIPSELATELLLDEGEPVGPAQPI